jgi:hypothetical protein
MEAVGLQQVVLLILLYNISRSTKMRAQQPISKGMLDPLMLSM